MKEVLLHNGEIAIVDDEDWELVSKYQWTARKNGSRYYASKTLSMHQLILGVKSGCVVDHINGDTLDNRRANLRFASKSQNAMNTCLRSDNTSGYRGVSWNKNLGKWVAYIKSNRKRIHLGQFAIPEEAARAYDEAAKIHFGSFARLNFDEQASNVSTTESGPASDGSG